MKIDNRTLNIIFQNDTTTTRTVAFNGVSATIAPKAKSGTFNWDRTYSSSMPISIIPPDPAAARYVKWELDPDDAQKCFVYRANASAGPWAPYNDISRDRAHVNHVFHITEVDGIVIIGTVDISTEDETLQARPSN